MDLKSLSTESRNDNTLNIDTYSTMDIVRKINEEDKKVASAVESELPNIARAVDIIARCISSGGRVFYVGAGTSGRLGVLDALECPPTFGTNPETFQGIMAGGIKALSSAAEDVEDDSFAGESDLKEKGLLTKDVVVGLAASGRTPYVLGALVYAKGMGCSTIGISCNTGSSMEKNVDVMIAPVPGPEVIMGSTRLKAGTAQKMVLNMLSTASMIRLGKVYTNLMVDMKASNGKLFDRAKRIVKVATGADDDIAEKILKDSGYNSKTAILMILEGIDREQAEERLDKSGGYIRKALRGQE
jgi:N-acetylmuramic acid 6-phosphate etherase